MIIAFYSQQSYAGKDTCADHAAEILRARGLGGLRDAFAWDGKVVAADALGIQGTREEKIAAIDLIKLHGRVEWTSAMPIDDVQIAGKRVTGRDFIIGLLGSPGKNTGIRGLSETFWTTQVKRRAFEALHRYGHWTVVSDLRFLEEAEGIVDYGGKVVEVVRPEGSLGTFNEQRVPDELIYAKIVNDGTLEGLKNAVERVVGRIIDDWASPKPVG